MKKLGRKLKLLRQTHGYTQKELANLLHIKDPSTISQWERGVNSPYGKDLVKLSQTFKVSSDYLLGIGEKVLDDIHTYNYLPTTISAGTPITVEAITQADKIPIPDEIMGKYAGKNDLFVTRVSGDSMDKVMADKSLIVVQSIDNLSTLKNGDIVVYSNDHEYSVKHYYKDGNKLIFKPNSTNPIHYDQIYNVDDNITIHGKVVVYIVNLD